MIVKMRIVNSPVKFDMSYTHKLLVPYTVRLYIAYVRRYILEHHDKDTCLSVAQRPL
jgi:hypothetical protein